MSAKKAVLWGVFSLALEACDDPSSAALSDSGGRHDVPVSDRARDDGHQDRLLVDAPVSPDAESDRVIGDAPGDGPPRTAASCFEDMYVTPPDFGLDYDQFHPTVASHCLGTDQQEIEGIERIVFLGDSVTVGTPPTLPGQMFRNALAERLADRFGLAPPAIEFGLWQQVDFLNGRSLVQDAGPFSSCATWGAKTDDLLSPVVGQPDQLGTCFPPDRLDERTLVILTIGGNNIAAIAKDGHDMTRTVDQLWDDTRAFVGLLRAAIDWLKEPGRFTNGVFVIFSNPYEFTDGTGDVASCPAADLGGFGGMWADPTALENMVVWATEQYLSIAVEHGVDMIFALEHFCGHGYHNEDPSAPCYRGPGTPRWFDLTCTHPNPAGHAQLVNMFAAIVDE